MYSINGEIFRKLNENFFNLMAKFLNLNNLQIERKQRKYNKYQLPSIYLTNKEFYDRFRFSEN